MRRTLSLVLAFLLGFALARGLPAGRFSDAAAGGAVGGPADFADVIERVDAGVVQITNYLSTPRAINDPGEASDNVGSGFVYSSDGLIVTNAHVTTGAKMILVEVKGRGQFSARLLASDPVVDVSLLKVDATGLTPVPIGDPRALRVGQWVIAAGSPYRLPRSYSVGIVSGLNRSDVVNAAGYEDFIQTDAAVNLGNSGGPLLDAGGRVVGMNTAILSRSGGNQGIALALPIDMVQRSVEQLKATGRVVYTTLGIVVRAVDPLEASQIPGGQGIKVTRFDEQSPGRRGGIAEGDVILKLDGTPVPSKGTLQRLVWSRPPGASVQVEIWRNGGAYTVTCVLAAR